MDAEQQPKKPAKKGKERPKRSPKERKYEEPLKVDMDFDEFVERVVRVKPDSNAGRNKQV